MCVLTGVDIDAINYVTKFTTKMKAKFSYCDQINFNEQNHFQDTKMVYLLGQ